MFKTYNAFRQCGAWWIKRRKLLVKLFWVNIGIWFWVIYLGLGLWNEITAPEIVFAQSVTQIAYKELPVNVKDTLDYYARLYNVDINLVYKIVKCESNFSTERNGDGHMPLTSRGLWQFQPQTFFSYAAKYSIKNADINDFRDQTIVAMQMLRDGKGSNWTCYNK